MGVGALGELFSKCRISLAPKAVQDSYVSAANSPALRFKPLDTTRLIAKVEWLADMI
jgi:hypothetical protein